MSLQLQCTMCGRNFTSETPALLPICRECEAASVSEEPPQPQPKLTAIQSGPPRVSVPVDADDAWAPEIGHDPPGCGCPQIVAAILLVALGLFALLVYGRVIC